MRAELFRPDSPDDVVAVVAWNDGRPAIEAGAGVAGMDGLLRAVPVQIDDASLRRMGTSGSSLLMPGSLSWFRAAVTIRAAALGYGVRFASAVTQGGWDPASSYRRFMDQAERLQA